MPFTPNENASNANFSTHVWLNDNDDDGINSSYTSLGDAQAAFDKLEAGGRYEYGGLYRWNHGKQDWDCLDAWPESFDGGSSED